MVSGDKIARIIALYVTASFLALLVTIAIESFANHTCISLYSSAQMIYKIKKIFKITNSDF